MYCKDEVLYQPIMAIESNTVYGYEIIRNFNQNFDDEPNDNKNWVKNVFMHFNNKCMNDELLFMPLSFREISYYCKNPSDMPLIVYAKNNNINFKRIVIEINQESFENSLRTSVMALSYCRSLGIRLALDKFGENGIDVLRLSQLSPDIIKIDKRLVHESQYNPVFRDFLANQTEFLSKLGTEVIYNGIESMEQLNNCVKSAGRYFQGDFIKKPENEIADFDKSKIVEDCFIKSIMRFNSKNIKRRKLKAEIDDVVKILSARKVFAKDRSLTDERIMNSADLIPKYIKRIYLCNKYGFQTTSNIEFLDGKIEVIDNYNKNWAWRGYFKEALFNITPNSKSYITHSYKDITTREKIYTYVARLNSVTYFFADISLNCI